MLKQTNQEQKDNQENRANDQPAYRKDSLQKYLLLIYIQLLLLHFAAGRLVLLHFCLQGHMA